MSSIVEGGGRSILKSETIQKILEVVNPKIKRGLKERLEKECSTYKRTKDCAERFAVEPIWGDGIEGSLGI